VHWLEFEAWAAMSMQTLHSVTLSLVLLLAMFLYYEGCSLLSLHNLMSISALIAATNNFTLANYILIETSK